MNKEQTIQRTPHSTDKIKIKQHVSKSLSKYSPSTSSPGNYGKASQKETRDLGVIKEKVKKKHKDEKKGNGKTKTTLEGKNK